MISSGGGVLELWTIGDTKAQEFWIDSWCSVEMVAMASPGSLSALLCFMSCGMNGFRLRGGRSIFIFKILSRNEAE